MNMYRKKPVTIEAVQYDGTNSSEIAEFIGKGVMETEKLVEEWVKTIDIETLEGTMTASKGDYIIKGVQGEFYLCKPDIFEMTYDKVNSVRLGNI